jgi:hypothetical protein
MQRKPSYLIAVAGAAFKARYATILLGVAFVSATPIAAAQDISLSTRTTCNNGYSTQNIVYVGRTMKGQLKGNWADWITAVSTNRTLITATFSNPVGNWSNSTMDVVFRVRDSYDADYDPHASVTVKIAPPLQSSYSRTTDEGLTVIGAPTLTAVSVPKADFYQIVDVTLTGTYLKGANVATAIAKVDLSHPVVGYGGEAVQITNGASIPAALVGTPTESQAVVRLSLPQKVTRISVDTKLSATNPKTCSPFGTGPGTEPSPTVSRRVTLAVPAPAAMPNIRSAEVINAKVDSDAEFTITLNKPVPFPVSAPRVLTGREPGQPGQVLDPFGSMVIYWKMSPSNVFKGATGGVSYDPNGGFNRVTMSPGESVKRFKLSVVSLPAGSVNVGTAYLQTWIGDNTKNEAPYFFQKDFTIVR